MGKRKAVKKMVRAAESIAWSLRMQAIDRWLAVIESTPSDTESAAADTALENLLDAMHRGTGGVAAPHGVWRHGLRYVDGETNARHVCRAREVIKACGWSTTREYGWRKGGAILYNVIPIGSAGTTSPTSGARH